MKKAFASICKLLLIICLSVCLILPVQATNSYAEDLNPSNYGEPGDTGETYDEAFIQKYAGKLSTWLYTIAVAIAIVCIMIVGIMYITNGVTRKSRL